MTGPAGNREFCFPEIQGKTKFAVSRGGGHFKVFCFISQLKNGKKKLRRNRLLDADWLTNFPRFQRARPDGLSLERSRCYFPGELVSFVRPKKFVLLQSKSVFELGGITMDHNP